MFCSVCREISALAVLVFLAAHSQLAAQSSTPHLDSLRQPELAQRPVLRKQCFGESPLASACPSDSALAFSSGPFDRWFSLLAGSNANVVTVDPSGQIYIAGETWNGLPVTPTAFQPTYPSDFNYITGFLLKLDSTGSKVIYGTYLNGLWPRQVAVDGAGYIYVLALHVEQNADYTAITYPAPITPGAVQAYPGTDLTPTLLKIAPSGELVYATFLGGTTSLPGAALAVDGNGSAVVCGSTADPALVASPGAFQGVLHNNYDVFVAKLSPDGTVYEAFTFLGGDGIDRCAGLQLDSAENIYVFGDTNSRFFPVTPGAYQTTRGAGWDLFVAKLDPSMHQLFWSTYIGGDWDTVAQTTLNGLPSGYQSLALAADGSVVFTGTADASDYPVSSDTGPPPTGLASEPRAGEPVFGVLDPSGSELTLSWPLPLNGSVNSVVTGDGTSFFLLGIADAGSDIAANATLNAQGMNRFLGLDSSAAYPFLARIDVPSRALTYLGPLGEISNVILLVGSGVAPDDSLVLASSALGDYSGATVPVASIGGVVSPGYGSVIFDLNFSGEKQPLVIALVNPASLLASPITPGQLIEVRGLGLASGSSPTVAVDPANPPLELAGTQLLIDGAAAPLFSVKDNSIVALAPPGPFSESSSVLSVISANAQSDPRTVLTGSVNAALFTTSGTGAGQALATNQDGSANSSQNPARKGQILRLFATGLGVTAAAADGESAPTAAIAATLADRAAQVENISSAAGYPAGYFAIDIVVPFGVPEGDFVSVAIAADGMSSQPGVTVSIR